MSFAAAVVLAVVAAGVVLSVRRPFVGLLVYLWLDFVRPHDFLPELRAWRPMLVLGAATLAAAAWGERRRWRATFGALAPMLVFVAAVGLSALGSSERAASLSTLVEAGKMAALVWLVFVLGSSSARREAVLWTVAASLLVFATLALQQAVQRGLFHEFVVALVVAGPEGPFRDNNDIARVLSLSVPLWWLLFRNRRGAADGVAAAAGGWLATAGVVATFSRGGFLALVAGVAAVSALTVRPLWRAAAIPPLFVAALLLVAPQPYRERVLTIARPQAESSVQGRMEIWREGLRTAGANPLAGQGPGTLRVGEKRRTSHNIFIELLAETGAIGLGAYVFVLATAFACLHRARRAGESAREFADFGRVGNASVGLEAALVAYLTAGLTLGSPLQSPLFVLIGLALGLGRRSDFAA